MVYKHPFMALLWKEFALDIRNKNGLWSLLLYTVGSIYIVYAAFQVKLVKVSPPTWNALFWILVVFNAFQSISKSFFHESENRTLYYYFNTLPEWVILSKILYNSLLVFVLGIISWGMYALVLGDPLQNKAAFLLVICIGAVGLSATLSLISSIAAKAGRSYVLLAVLGFPVLLPLLLFLIKTTSLCIDGFSMLDALDKWIILGCIDGIVIVLAWILYPFIWKN